MDLTRKQKTIKYFCYCLILILADLLQNVSGLFPEVFTARCFILLPVVIVLSMGEDVLNGAFLGLFAGLLWDINAAEHMGFNCIFIAVICFLSCSLISYIARDTLITAIIICVAAIGVYCLVYWLFFVQIKGIDGSAGILAAFYLPCFIYTSLLSPLFYLILKPLKRKLNHSPKEKI